MDIEDRKAQHAEHLEVIKAIIVYDHNTVKYLMMLNGSAVVALLTFFSSIVTHLCISADAMLGGIIFFAIGTAAAVILNILERQSQDGYQKYLAKQIYQNLLYEPGEFLEKGTKYDRYAKLARRISITCFFIGCAFILYSLFGSTVNPAYDATTDAISSNCVKADIEIDTHMEKLL